MVDSILQQIKARRLALGFKQKDMAPRVDMARQQYQRLEAKGNPRLETLELVAAGLNSELLLIPREKLDAVLAVLSGDAPAQHTAGPGGTLDDKAPGIADDPWKGLLEDLE